MLNVSVRELRNHTSDVLRKVEAGERMLVTVNRRPIAELVPLDTRPTWVSGKKMRDGLLQSQADPGLRDQLRELLPQTTDEL